MHKLPVCHEVMLFSKIHLGADFSRTSAKGNGLAVRGWVAASSPIDMAVEFREIDFEYGESDQLSHETNSESSATTSTLPQRAT